MAIDLKQSDFSGIGDVASHCDKRKLKIAINEAILFDLKPLLCAFFDDVDQNWQSTDPNWNKLINGGKFENCDGKDVGFEGLKKTLCYYAYARYVVINNFNDTSSGGVTKTNNFSVPKPLDELRAFSNKYRKMAYQLWEMVEAYLCRNSDLFPEFDTCNCEKCGCNGKCCNGNVNTKGFGYRGKVIEKY